MKITCVLGSPRKNGNSSTIVKQFCKAASANGADITTFYLNDISFQGCQACSVCKTKQDTCVLNDGLTEVLESVKVSELLVFASPVYFGNLTGQAKLFLDRCYCFLVPDFHTNPETSRLNPGKKMVFVQTQGQENSDVFSGIFPEYDYMFNLLGFKDNRLIRGCGLVDPTDVLQQEAILKEAETLAADLIRS